MSMQSYTRETGDHTVARLENVSCACTGYQSRTSLVDIGCGCWMTVTSVKGMQIESISNWSERKTVLKLHPQYRRGVFNAHKLPSCSAYLISWKIKTCLMIIQSTKQSSPMQAKMLKLPNTPAVICKDGFPATLNIPVLAIHRHRSRKPKS